MTDMNKSALIEAVAGKTALTKAQAREALDGIIAAINATTRNGGAVKLPGFGLFREKTRPARTARNPQTGEDVQVPERQALHFRPAKLKS
ncbi:HU family DNA-binding protein [Paracoccus sp. DMF-8]|uniref:HU family DNA-binding protein n=1 Tax=Paracoccus sp. DMF-8 TaxID=3019445 RepID=UPI0023E464D0|nr:HU family DNA-binding protein [Paracoccus sp. DMF-8]MDF3607517.1 HU family DNA-binding protein [Paracoccus sp. DMF-8]